MPEVTEQMVLDFLDTESLLQKRAKEVAVYVATVRGTTRNPETDFERVEFGGVNTFEAYFEYYCCGDHERDSISIPIEYLWDDGEFQKEKERVEQSRAIAQKAAEEAAQKAEEKRKRDAETAERKTYERLKVKYEAGS